MPLTVSVMCPDLETARAIAKAALQARLVACANILPGVESHYWWDGKLEQDPEVALSFKTPASHRPDLVALIDQLHPYDLAAITWSDDGAPWQVTKWVETETASGG